MKTVITSCGPFREFEFNPNNQVMKAIWSGMRESQIPDNEYVSGKLNVSWAEVDQFLQRLSPHSFDLFIHLGFVPGSNQMSIDTSGSSDAAGKDVHNSEPDYSIFCTSESKIAVPLPFEGLCKFLAEHPEVVISDNAGRYLCNYMCFRAIEINGDKAQVLFIHITDNRNEATAPGIERQADLVLEIRHILHTCGQQAIIQNN
jgi:pyrrolidone-carboxylate peptidase